jgi:hypothetical protein
MTNNKKQRTMNYLKQTQTKPILPALTAGKIALSAAEGPVVTKLSRLSAVACLSSVASAKEEAKAEAQSKGRIYLIGLRRGNRPDNLVDKGG